MKPVLISIQPKWCELIASGKKTIEVRKTFPKVNIPFKVYIYCTQGRDNLYSVNGVVQKLNEIYLDLKQNSIVDELNGKVIGEFVCETVTYAKLGEYCILPKSKTLIDELDLMDYANGKPLFGWHISNLVIYDKPKELSELGLTRPPQSWCYVESEVEGE